MKSNNHLIKKITVQTLFVFILLSSCTVEQKSDEKCTVKHPDWAMNAVIYEVNTRQYTPEGTFAAFEQHLPRLKELGVDILWFMPIYPVSEKNRKGTLGSYYAVSDYTAVNQEFGTMEDFQNLVKKAHELGFKVILDWVANHTGCDNVWLAEHKDWYVLDSAGEPVSPYDWTDTYKLNYDNAEMRRAMIDAMKFWLQNANIDGFRCDMAHEVPTDFWNEVRPALDNIKPVFMLAETEQPDLTDHAFDCNYGWEMLHLMEAVAKGEKNAGDIHACLFRNDTLICPNAMKMLFTSNHDENSWSGTEFERFGEQGAKTFAVFTYVLGATPLIYTGQETGMHKRLSFFEKDTVPSWEKNEYFTFYQKLNQLKYNYLKYVRGAIFVSYSGNFFQISYKKDKKQLVAMFNFSHTTAVNYEKLPAGYAETGFADFFTGETVEVLPKELQAWEYKIFVR